MIPPKNLRPGLCPICGDQIGRNPPTVRVHLNNGSYMDQPVCFGDTALLMLPENLDALVESCKAVWLKEIQTGDMTPEIKEREIKRVSALQVQHGK